MPELDNLDAIISDDGTKLTITVDLTKDLGESKSGKSIIIATTHGNATIQKEDGEKKKLVLGFNLYTPKKE